MHNKQQQAVSHTYVQQAVYSSSKQCSKAVYAAVATSSVASSSSISAAAQFEHAALLIPTANTSTTQLLLYSYAVDVQ